MNENWSNFKDTLFVNMKKSIPTRKLKNKQEIPWLKKETKRMLRKKRRLYKRARRSNDSEDYTEFKNFRIKARNKLHSDYHKYLNNLLDPEQDSTSKNFWKYIKARKQDSVSIGTLKSDGSIAETAENKANMLNKQFISVFTKEDLSNIPDKGQSPYVPMNEIIINENGVRKCIERLNEKKACGPDKIPIKVLKQCGNELAPILTCIFKQSLSTGEVPLDWKHANVVPIFKKGNRCKPENYRPVSLTVVISKMLEHIIVSQIMNHLDSQNILHENQHGFRAKRSCESQLLMTTDDISKSLNSGKQVDMAILDFSKAFDKVSYERLSRKLKYYGLDEKTRTWINSFLTDRKQQVVVDNATSDIASVTSGVPQGTVLGPTLFLIYINDIADNITSNIRLFADDCVLYRTINSTADNLALQQDLDKLELWSNTWQMDFNVKKCAIMQFTTPSTPKQKFDYKMKGEILEIVSHHPYLGVEFSDNLKFNDHIDNITKNSSSTLGFLKRNLKYCPPKVKEKAYSSLVRPKLEYASPIWNPTQKTQIKQIEQVQRNAARWVMNQPYNPHNPSSVTDMIAKLNWPSLQQRRVWADVTLMYKVVNCLIAVPVIYHPVAATVRSTRRSHSMKFIPIQARINAYHHSFFPRTVTTWNMIPESCIASASLDAFKSSIQLVSLVPSYK